MSSTLGGSFGLLLLCPVFPVTQEESTVPARVDRGALHVVGQLSWPSLYPVPVTRLWSRGEHDDDNHPTLQRFFNRLPY